MAGLYLHIPFCKSRCHYCDFFSTVPTGGTARYAEALIAEMERERGFLGDHPLRTIYLGGGTPSLLDAAALEKIFAAAGRLWDLAGLQEVTLEANPDDLSPRYLTEIVQLPIDRLSIGIQSFDDNLLRLMNRRHTVQTAVEAVRDARRAGFGNISIDLIYGIPGMTQQQWTASIRRALELHPEHISAYHLTIEPGTPFGRQGLQPVPDAQSERQYDLLCEQLDGAGYTHYEISNFALPEREARHNSGYWNGEAYLGLGPSAHSYDGVRLRRWSHASLDDYLAGPAYESEILSDKDLYNEYVMVSLRTARGVDPGHIASKFGARVLHYFNSSTRPLLESGMLVRQGDRIVIPSTKFFVSDNVISTLFLE